MKHSKFDSILVLILLLQLVLFALPFAIEIPTSALVILVVINIALMGTNFQCVAHNFIHLPFFKNSSLNNIFSVLNTIGIGAPQSMYRLQHLDHHRHNNRPEVDELSTFRHGKDGKEENIFMYSMMGLVRTDLGGYYKRASKNSILPLIEVTALFTFFAVCFAISWKIAAFYILPSVLGGQFFAFWENYCEHHYANPYDRKRDSVSCYNRFYNLIWFNNGYHQEHHFSPQVHWTEITKVRAQLPDDRIIVSICHLANSF